MTASARPSGDLAARRAESGDTTGRRPRSVLALAIFGTLALLGFTLLIGLGVWQIERRAWKLDLIQRVDDRIHAAPVPAPQPSAWAALTKSDDEYRRVSATGRFGNANVLVQAVTDLGPGSWVMTPLRSADGFTALINRGFISTEQRAAEPGGPAAPAGDVTVTGLLRITEPKGGFLRDNDPVGQRWYSRDVDAIAASLKIQPAAPYFIDADTGMDGPGQPRGGLTVVSFPNNHLIYIITWFALALMLACGVWFVARDEWRIRQKSLSHV
ncbi:MAG: SURF1 family protein [Tardiphaga sp.]